MCPPLTFPRCPCSRGRCRLPSAPCGPAGAGGRGWFPLPPPPRCRRPARPRWLRGGPAGRCGHLRGSRELTEGSGHVPKTFKSSPQQPRSLEVHPLRLGGLKEQGVGWKFPWDLSSGNPSAPPAPSPCPPEAGAGFPAQPRPPPAKYFSYFASLSSEKKKENTKKCKPGSANQLGSDNARG